ncbi:hypothetical protein CCAX7_34400 [Capsulimonas corticalis]|uniref:Uncharacterized protein n=1 Tax=Capsulimonas corticalis TaxID=2219043 RepID=A0A402CYC4_9BACT|nr:hypothetical protein [Capsulimonas corticalis]BDI31389.1 hypothetical protein CCAX7_34400 [Capsulimonas corticalis]
MPQSKSLTDLPGRLIAILVFLAGIAMLCFVFMEAMHLFQSPVPGLALPVAKGATAPPAANIGAALATYVMRIGLLGLMALAGSVIASKGIHLYFAANQWAEAHGHGEKASPVTNTQNNA